MHVRIRFFGKPDTIVVVQSKLTTIEEFRHIIYQKFNIQPKSQKLFYGGKLLENGYTFHDYSIKLNDVIQLMVKTEFDGGSKDTAEIKKDDIADTTSEENLKYIDAASSLYEVGDLVDMRDQEQQGAWYEGKITRIVHDPKTSSLGSTNHEATSKRKSNNLDSEDDVENKPPHQSTSTTRDSSTPKRGINHYFSKSLKSEKSKPSVPVQDFNSLLLYQVKLDTEEDDDTGTYCKLKDIRPRARIELDSINLKVGQIVMINYNIDEPLQKGYWYDFKISEIKKTRYDYYLIGTLYLGPDAIPQNDTKIRVHDKIFKIEEVVPLAKRTEEYKKLMITPPEKRAEPIACQTCNDDESSQCKDCGCTLCSGKNSPDKILLCDECNKGYHMMCLDPPLTELPKEDWYCPSCRRDPNDVIAPGASKQVKKTSKSKRDWGRGMACVGKTKTCLMPPNHFGPIPGIEVGMCWRFRIQLSETGVHRPPVSGIHGRDVEGAYSIVLSGGYEDDVDNGNEFTYTGSGGRDLSGNKRTAEQSCDQTLTRENKALARNCAVKSISEEGGDAGDNWRSGKPVRVVRSYKMIKHFPKYAPKEGIRYDGIYKVVKYYPEKGLSGYRVWKYLLRRDDPNPAPWETEGKEYPIVYPDGYLEAEAEKKAQKINNRKSDHNKKKRALRETNQTTESDIEEAEAVPVKKQKMSIGRTEETNVKAVKLAKNHSKPTEKASPKDTSSGLSDEDKAAIKADTLNSKLWKDCLSVCETKSKKEFVEYITQEFCCIICQEVVVSPVTTPCRHNFCLGCIKNAFKVSGKHCPHCRANLADYCYEPNEELKTALRIILPGYDAGKR